MLYFKTGSKTASLTSENLKQGLVEALEKIGPKKRVLIIPPDFTRFHSRAGELTSYAWEYYKDKVKDILPALGTHSRMTATEIGTMFPGIPHKLFKIHNWRYDVVSVGRVPGSYVSEITDGALTYDWPAQLNKIIVSGDYDLILSIGQVVPHEVIGMANYNKNLFIGTGGAEAINKSHFIGAVYGMEKIMGRANNPVRRLLNYASETFITHLPVVYVHTVVGREESGELVVRGLFIGDDEEVFTEAADLSLNVNFTMLEKPLKKVVVYLDQAEYKSTWLGNKSIYRTRMALADGGELIVLAPGLREFGEDRVIDRLIRKYGYSGKTSILELLSKNADLQENLSAAAHLIHGSSEERFTIRYCPGNLSREEIEQVNFQYSSYTEMSKVYNPEVLKEGFNILPGGEEIFFISNPAVGLWSTIDRFKEDL